MTDNLPINKSAIHSAHMPNSGSNSDNRFISIADVMKTTSVGRSTIYDWITKDLFPKPIHIGPRRVAWRQSDIDLWKLEKIQTQDFCDATEQRRAAHAQLQSSANAVTNTNQKGQ